MSKVARVLDVEIIPDDVFKEKNMHYLLLATCKKYRNMIDKHLLYFMNCTFESRKNYYKNSADRNYNRSYLQASVWAMLLEQAVRLQNTYVIEWLMSTLQMKLTGKHDMVAPNATMRFWLREKGCPVWPKKKDRVIVSFKLYDGKYDHDGVAEVDGARGILIGIDGEDAIIKITSNSDIKIAHMSALIKDPAFA